MMLLLRKAHPVTQAMSAAAKPSDLNEPGLRRNPGEPDAKQAKASSYNKPRIEWQGLTIAVENPAGSVRRGRNRHGVTWEVRMRFDYGEILGTMGVDGDPVDVIVGPNLEAPMVYVVHQRRVNDWENFDEDKCCVGFDSQSDAEQAFLSNYNDPRFLGPITAMPVDEFVAKVRATKEKPAMIKSVLFFKAYVGPYLRGGKIVNATGYQGRSARAVASPGQMSLFGAGESQHTEPTRQLIEEHERLVDVLTSPSHEDDKAEAKKQAEELAEMKQEAAAATQPTKAQQTRARRQAVLDVLGEGWKAGAGVDGAKDSYSKSVTKPDGGRFEVTIMPEKTVDGDFYVGSYHYGGKRRGSGSSGNAKTLEEAKVVADGVIAAALKTEAKPAQDSDEAPDRKKAMQDAISYLGGRYAKQGDVLELASYIDGYGYSNSLPDDVYIPIKNAAAAINHITKTSRISTDHGLAARKLTGAKARKLLADVAMAGGLGSIQDHIDAFERIMGGSQPMTKSIVFVRRQA